MRFHDGSSFSLSICLSVSLSLALTLDFFKAKLFAAVFITFFRPTVLVSLPPNTDDDDDDDIEHHWLQLYSNTYHS